MQGQDLCGYFYFQGQSLTRGMTHGEERPERRVFIFRASVCAESKRSFPRALLLLFVGHTAAVGHASH